MCDWTCFAICAWSHWIYPCTVPWISPCVMHDRWLLHIQFSPHTTTHPKALRHKCISKSTKKTRFYSFWHHSSLGVTPFQGWQRWCWWRISRAPTPGCKRWQEQSQTEKFPHISEAEISSRLDRVGWRGRFAHARLAHARTLAHARLGGTLFPFPLTRTASLELPLLHVRVY